MTYNNLTPWILGISAAAIAQILKVFLYKIIHKKWDMFIFFTSGKMPSSHSAGFTAILVAIYYIDGWNSTTFTLALSLLTLVIIDSVNVRWHSGVAANKITNVIEQLIESKLIKHNKITETKLKLILGHRMPEVIVGMLVGWIVSFTFFKFMI